MSFFVDLALDIVGDALISKPSQRKRRMRQLKACATDVTRGDLPALSPESPATGAIRPASIAWAKLPAEQLYSEGKQLRRSDFQLIASALGYPKPDGG